RAAVDACGADVAVVRLPDRNGMLTARAVLARSEALAAELEGSSFPLAQLPRAEATGSSLPEAVRRGADRSRADDVVLLPAPSAGRPLGSLELMRSGRRFAPGELALARLAASHLGLVLRAFLDTNGATRGVLSPARVLGIAGDAL